MPPSTGLTVPTQQVRVLELFLAFCGARSAWKGALLLGIGLDHLGRALALASLAAGAAGLFLEGDPAKLRLAQREGCCTFTVSTLEEAVRALKNEIRQGRAVTLALSGTPAAHLTEMVARGLQPQAIVVADEGKHIEAPFVRVLRDRGAQVLNEPVFAARPDGSGVQSSQGRTAPENWEIRTDCAATLADRRSQDRALLTAAVSLAGPMAAAASQWLRAAPSLFPRALERAYLHDLGSD